MMERYLIVPSLAALALASACSGGSAPTTTFETYDEVPNNTDRPPPSSTPPATGEPDDGNGNGNGNPGGGYCERFCERMNALGCELEGGGNCANTCAERRDARCGNELTASLDCMLDRNACPDDLADPNAMTCGPLFTAYAECLGE